MKRPGSVEPLRLRVNTFLMADGLTQDKRSVDGPDAEKPGETVNQKPEEETWTQTLLGGLNNMFIEFVAAFLILAASIYEPHFAPDMLAQLIPGAAIILVMMALKDRHYFCPDGTPMVTLVLLCAGAYTGPNRDGMWDQLKKTQWIDVIMRLMGQIIAFVVLFGVVVSEHRGEMEDAPFHQTMGLKVLLVYELFASMVTCLGIAYCILPLLKPDTATRPKPDSTVPDDATKYNTFASKKDVDPPKNKSLFSAAIILALMQIVVERVFRATANPFVYGLHCKILPEDQCDATRAIEVAICQLGGLAIAGAYAYFYMPPPKVLSRILLE